MTADKDSLMSNEATEAATTMTTVVTATTGEALEVEEEASKRTEEEEEEEDITREDMTAIVGEETLVTTGTGTVLLRLLSRK